VKILCISFGPDISCAYAPGYIQTFISWTLFDLSNRKPLKNSTFVSCSVLTDFCQYLCLPLDRFLFRFFWSGNFWGSCYSSICFICGGFVWRKFSSVGIGEWWDELKNGQKLNLGDAHASPQEISKKYKCQSLGMPSRHPFFIGKNQVTFQDTIFLLLHALCVFLGASVFFSFQFSFVLFAAINGWTPTNSL
jgi:hypothetical protein